jgi:putative peptidoglycan lipid II flippase
VIEPEPAPPTGRGIASAAALIGIGNVSSRLLGLVREQVIAALFGATGATSAFRTATRVSTAVYDLLLSGATTAALVPVFTDYVVAQRTADLSRIVSTFVNLTLVGLGLIVGLLVWGAPGLVWLLGAAPEHFDLAVELTRIALPSIPLMGVAGILTAVLYARQSFRIPAFSAALFNVGIILTAISLESTLSIHGLALGLAVGAILQILVQAPALRGLSYLPVIDLGHPGVRQVARLYLPVMLGMLASYALVVLDTNLAWRTGDDSVAAMAFATTLIQFPLGLVGAAASLAILPSLTRLASDLSQASAFEDTLLQGLKMVVLLIVPIAVVMVVLREPVVSILFERASFDARATVRTAQALLAYSPQLPFVVVDQLLIVAFYARKNTLTPVLVGVGGIGAYLLVAALTIEPLGMPGLALANAVQNSAHAVVLYWLMARSLPALRRPALLGFVGAILGCAVGAAAMTWLVAGWMSPYLGSGPILVRLGALAIAAGAGVLVYAGILVLLRVPEARQVRALLWRLIRR